MYIHKSGTILNSEIVSLCIVSWVNQLKAAA